MIKLYLILFAFIGLIGSILYAYLESFNYKKDGLNLEERNESLDAINSIHITPNAAKKQIDLLNLSNTLKNSTNEAIRLNNKAEELKIEGVKLSFIRQVTPKRLEEEEQLRQAQFTLQLNEIALQNALITAAKNLLMDVQTLIQLRANKERIKQEIWEMQELKDKGLLSKSELIRLNGLKQENELKLEFQEKLNDLDLTKEEDVSQLDLKMGIIYKHLGEQVVIDSLTENIISKYEEINRIEVNKNLSDENKKKSINRIKENIKVINEIINERQEKKKIPPDGNRSSLGESNEDTEYGRYIKSTDRGNAKQSKSTSAGAGGEPS